MISVLIEISLQVEIISKTHVFTQTEQTLFEQKQICVQSCYNIDKRGSVLSFICVQVQCS